ncbi:nitrilase-related carbon-nitrogen hydrolase [Streptomyces hypolithicus]
MRIALAQTDCELGKVEADFETAHKAVRMAAEDYADLVVFPELSLHGYDLGGVGGDESISADDPRLAALSGLGPDVLAGFHEDGRLRRYNSAAYLSGGAVVHTHRKLYRTADEAAPRFLRAHGFVGG